MATSDEGNVGKVADTVVLEKMRDLEKLMLAVSAENEKLRNHHEQKFNELADKLQSMEASIQKSNNVSEIDESTVLTNNTKNMSSKPEKKFQLKHVFKDVANFIQYIYHYSNFEEHYNVKWSIAMIRRGNHLGFFIYCNPDAPADKWSIQTKLEYKVVGRVQNEIIRTFDYCYEKAGSWGFIEFQEWEEMKKWYLVDGNLTVEAKVTIIETTGLAKPKIRKFDESQKDISDVILVVWDTKFYVSKMYLAAQSSVFKALLFGNFKESKQSEVTLNGIDPDDFHYFLEVLYGEFVINDLNVEDIALLADMYDTPTALRRCEEFLLKESKKTVEMKLEIATQYNMENLKEKCRSQITTTVVQKKRKVTKKNPLRKLFCF
ncbi:hypothetical protein B9Z55_007722 [Caenorhabditis nigoni]|uniref:BTB domain-containing protein n=1 Tax=Caenorhabditis nigoni TaxID=1611254 RepID=A0A2G5VB03_9PELO|nr:hypothetical protein B9Z55_007722 [Caenorhabditis nigoni]